MRTIDEYMDAAKARNAFTSDRALARALSINASSANAWRTKRGWPADHTMRRLAVLAGLDPTIALIELNVWRSEPEAAEVYKTLLDHLPNHRDAA